MKTLMGYIEGGEKREKEVNTVPTKSKKKKNEKEGGQRGTLKL